MLSTTQQNGAPAVPDGLHVLMQPGWQNSNPQHWQSVWERELGASASRIAQSNWQQPVLADWLTHAEEAIADAPDRVVLVAHSLGCVLTAYLADRPAAERIAAAFLAAPADVDRPGCPPELKNFAPVPRGRLPFPTVLVASDDDPYCPLERSREFAESWGAAFHTLHAAGHISATSGYGAWPEGLRMLGELMARAAGDRGVR